MINSRWNIEAREESSGAGTNEDRAEQLLPYSGRQNNKSGNQHFIITRRNVQYCLLAYSREVFKSHYNLYFIFFQPAYTNFYYFGFQFDW